MSSTLKEIALQTGLSIPTVHQVLNGYKVRFSEETRRKVLDAAKALDYRPNIAARGLRAKKSFLLGLQFNSVNSSLIVDFTLGFQQACMAENFTPIFLTHSNLTEEAANVRTLLDRRVDGIVANAAVGSDGATNAALYAELKQSGTPLVELFGSFINDVPRATLDYRAAGEASTRLLLEQGHRRIALFTHADYRASERVPGLLWTAWEHYHGCLQAMAAAGLEPIVLTHLLTEERDRCGSAVYFGAYVAAQQVFGHPDRPTAAVCYCGGAAEALVHFAEAHPSVVPEGFGIAVFEDVRPAISKSIRLNILTVPAEKIGGATARMLIDVIAGKQVGDVAMGPTVEGPATDLVPHFTTT